MDYERWAELADREAAGEKLKPDELEFIRRYAEEHGECRAEMDFWRHLGDLDSPSDDLRDRTVALKALQVVQQSRAQERSRVARHRRNLILGLAGMAAAAAVALAINGGPKPAPVTASASIPIVWSTTEVRVDGAPTRADKVREGSVVEVSGGTACLEVGPAIFACLAPNSRVRATHFSGPKRRMDVLSGSVAVALQPQPAGARFSVVAKDVWSTAVGTAFSVSIDAKGAVETDVYEGKVLVGGEHTGEIVPAHKLGLSSSSGVRVEALEGAPEGIEWTALEKVSGKHFEPAVETESTSETAPSARTAAAGTTGGREQAVAKDNGEQRNAEPAAKTAEEVLLRARQFRRDQQWASAAAAYRDLQQRFPDSAEAHASRVSLGELELEYLGDATHALASFDAYLRQGGPLSVEAELGRIRAYRALGNRQQEISAITSFLSRHPQSTETNALRERLRALAE